MPSSIPHPRSLFCFGLGYSARAFVRALAAKDTDVMALVGAAPLTTVAGTTRDPDAWARAHGARHPAVRLYRLDLRDNAAGDDGAAPAACANEEGAGVLQADLLPEDVLQAAREADVWLVSLAPDARGDRILRALGTCAAQLSVHAPHAFPNLKTVVYLSSTGVYGDALGAWVDEASPVSASQPRGRARALAERQWRAFCVRVAANTGACRLAILRLGSIYGPGRTVLEALRAGTARNIVRTGQVFSRIHETDLAKAIALGLCAPEALEFGDTSAGAILNVCDDEPASPQAVLVYACALTGFAMPRAENFADAGLSPLMASFYGECKRVSNQKLRALLAHHGVGLSHPTYREGLTHEWRRLSAN